VLCQAATLALVATVLAVSSSESLLECTCEMGDHRMCPMHHHAAPGVKVCLMRGADSDGAAVLTTLFGAIAIPPSRTAVALRSGRATVIPVAPTSHSLRPLPPDPPPPRA
jgi:hypothetical protein